MSGCYSNMELDPEIKAIIDRLPEEQRKKVLEASARAFDALANVICDLAPEELDELEKSDAPNKPL